MQLRGVPGGERPLVQWLLVALALVIVGLAALVVRRDRAATQSIRTLQAELGAAAGRELELERQAARERAAREAFQIGLGRERAANAPQGIPLVGGLDPSGLPKQQVRLPPDAPRVQFVLPLEDRRVQRLARYRAVLRAFSSGEEIWMHAMLHADADARRLFVAVPVDVLLPGSYELALTGLTERGQRRDVDAFTFEIVR